MIQDSVFIKTFGRAPISRLLDFLIENNTFDYPKSEIARFTGISRVTLDKILPQFLKNGIIKETRHIGRATMYQFDRSSTIGKALLKLDFAITKQSNYTSIIKKTVLAKT